MALIKKKQFYLSLIISGLLNAIIGGVLIHFSFEGHSSIGIIIGAIVPLAALSFYGDGYGKYLNLEITKDLLPKVFRPSIKIA